MFNQSPLAQKDIFNELSNVPLETLKGLFGESLQQLRALVEDLESEDARTRAEALERAAAIKSALKNQIKKLYEDAGSDFPSFIASLKQGLGK